MELLQGFVDEAWTHEIVPEQLERLDRSFVLANYQSCERDLLYRLTLDNQEIYLYLLLENQPRADELAVLRLLLYMRVIWREHIKESGVWMQNRQSRLPVIIPILMYNGERPWPFSRNFKDLFDHDERFPNKVPDYRYHLIDVNCYAEDELIRLGTPTAAVLLLDQRRDLDVYLKRLKRLAETMKRWETGRFHQIAKRIGDSIGRAMDEVNRREIRRILAYASPKEADVMMQNLERTVKDALEKAARKGKDAGRLEGIMEGRREGIHEGRREGKLEGRHEGILEGKLEVARRMLKQGMPSKAIKTLTGLSDAELNTIM